MRTAGWVVVVGASLGWLIGCEGPQEEIETVGRALEPPRTRVSRGGDTTLEFLPPGQRVAGQAASAAAATARTDADRRARVSVFYPTGDQQSDGLCWQGLTIDRANNLYPIGSGEFYRVSPAGILVNGVGDENVFASQGFSDWGVLDERVRRFFTAFLDTVRSAPFVEGSVFEELVNGLGRMGTAVALGRGPLHGSLLVTDQATQAVYRVTLRPLRVKLFANGPLFDVPEAIASAPNGTVYVVNVGSTLEPAGRSLLRITPRGSVRVFARSRDTAARRMLNVDNKGTVFWSRATGIDRFRPDGSRLAPLPGPNDQPAFENPMGSAFDRQGSLFVVENFGCKKIYKYSFRR